MAENDFGSYVIDWTPKHDEDLYFLPGSSAPVVTTAAGAQELAQFMDEMYPDYRHSIRRLNDNQS